MNALLDANADKKLRNFTNSERMKTPKTDCLLKFKKAKKSISLDFRFVKLENTGFPATYHRVLLSFLALR